MGMEVPRSLRTFLILPALTLSGMGVGFIPLVLLTLTALLFRLPNTLVLCATLWFLGSILGYCKRRRGTPLD